MSQAIKTYQTKIKKRDMLFVIPKSRFFLTVLSSSVLCYFKTQFQKEFLRFLGRVAVVYFFSSPDSSS